MNRDEHYDLTEVLEALEWITSDLETRQHDALWAAYKLRQLAKTIRVILARPTQ